MPVNIILTRMDSSNSLSVLNYCELQVGHRHTVHKQLPLTVNISKRDRADINKKTTAWEKMLKIEEVCEILAL